MIQTKPKQPKTDTIQEGTQQTITLQELWDMMGMYEVK